MSFPNSGGWGAGYWGWGPCGHGPYPLFPTTPSYVHGEELAYAVQAYQFEDLNEHRYLLSDERGFSLSYQFTQAGSAMAQEVNSFYLAAEGGPFLVTDHRTGRRFVARFEGPVRTTRGNPRKHDIEAQFVSLRDFTYPEEVFQDAPAFYWRLTDAPTVPGIVGFVSAAGSGGGGVYLTIRTEPIDLLTDGFERNSAMNSWATGGTGQGVAVVLSRAAFQCSGSFALECIFQSLATTTNSNVMLVRNLRGDSPNTEFYQLELTLAGELQFAIKSPAGLTPVAKSPGSYRDGRIHHVVGVRRRSATALELWVDGVFVTSAADTTSTNSAIGGGNFDFMNTANPTTLLPGNNALNGYMREVAVYSFELSPARIRAHYIAFAKL